MKDVIAACVTVVICVAMLCGTLIFFENRDDNDHSRKEQIIRTCQLQNGRALDQMEKSDRFVIPDLSHCELIFP